MLVTAGRSIAVQNFNENLGMLAMLGVFASLMALDVDVRTVMAGLGVLVAACVAGLGWRVRLRPHGAIEARRA